MASARANAREGSLDRGKFRGRHRTKSQNQCGGRDDNLWDSAFESHATIVNDEWPPGFGRTPTFSPACNVAIKSSALGQCHMKGAWSNTIPSGALIPVDPEPSLPSDWDIDLQRSGCDKPVRMPRALKRSIEKSVQEAADGPALADCARLAAMDRYERRALSRRKFAIREFDAARKALA